MFEIAKIIDIIIPLIYILSIIICLCYNNIEFTIFLVMILTKKMIQEAVWRHMKDSFIVVRIILKGYVKND
jgi:hypothetical protein